MPLASAQSGWSIVNSPSGSAPLNYLSAVTCVSATDCWAVGYDNNGSAEQTLIEHWNGTSWTLVPSPNASRTQDHLTGVTCVSASDCWAVGHSFNNISGAYDTLIERWDGTSWAIVSSPNNASQFNFLLGVTCVSASNCWAVGDYYRYDPPTGRNIPQTLIERWDGTSWAIINSPNTSASKYNFLSSVTCASASDCFAVGIHFSDLGIQTLIERWDGTSWAILPSPNTSPSDDNYLSGVTCVSATDCFAVGTSTRIDSGYRTLIERWDGTSWAIVPSPNAADTQHNLLSGVTCASATDCWAVGHKSGNTRSFDTLIERWNGTSWAIVTSPNTSSPQSDQLLGVMCASATDCWAVGHSNNTDFVARTLVERWNGISWSILTSPNGLADPPLDTFLNSVTCMSASECWAVGKYFNGSVVDGSVYQTLVERWDGTSWVIVLSPNANSTQNNQLDGVTCASASDCWAVGSYYNGSVNQTLIERWDGTSWAVVTSPNTNASQNNFLSDVTCASASECWAAGSYSNGSANQTLIERWDGTSWAIVPSPNTSTTQTNVLAAVMCGSASGCWALGHYDNGSAFQTLIERWDGTSWAIVNSPNTDTAQSNLLSGVTCTSASDCWAVGSYYNGSKYQTLIERYTAIAPLTPTSVVSRKTHGTAGIFDINLPLTGNPGIECRSGGTARNYRVIVTFPSAVTCNNAQVTGGTGSVSNFSVNASGTKVTVNLTGVSNAQTITVTLLGVNDGNNTGDVAVPMGVLLGDTTANRAVNSSDISQTKSKSGQVVTGANFRQDVTINGSVNSSDISLVKSKSGTALP